MNVIDLISSMEDIIVEGQIPLFKSKSMVNIDEFLEMLDELKTSLGSIAVYSLLVLMAKLNSVFIGDIEHIAHSGEDLILIFGEITAIGHIE